MPLTDKIKDIIVKHGESFLGEEGVDEAVCEAAAKEIASKLEEADDVIIFDAHKVPHRFAVCAERDCGKIFNACNLEPIKDEPLRGIKGSLADEEIDGRPVYAGLCPYCRCPAKYTTDHENKLARASYKMADKICQNINVMSSSTCRIVGNAFADGLAQQHRTLQQEFGRSVLVQIVRKFAEMGHKGEMDGRNEAFCKLCLKLLPILEDTHLPYL